MQENAIDREDIAATVSYLFGKIMGEFPANFKELINLLPTSTSTPAFTMSPDESKFRAVELSLTHLGFNLFAVQVAQITQLLMRDRVYVIWVRMTDPERKLLDMLASMSDLAFDDTVRNERYLVSNNTIVNCAYSSSGEASVCFILREREALSAYCDTSNVPIEVFAAQMLEAITE